MYDFSAEDTVQVGLNGEKGKITDIVHPLGTYCMYKVQLFNDGQIITVAKHELVKGLPDHLFNFEKQTNQSIATHTVSLDEIYTKSASSTVSRNETYVFEDSVLDDIDSTELNKLLSYVDNSTLQSFDQAPYVAEKLYELPESKPNLPLPAQANRFVRSVEIDQYLFENENSSTRRKTLSHQKLLENYLALKNEHRPIQQIPASELDVHISQFFIGVRQKNGQEYEPVTLRSMLSSFERYLKRHNYDISLITAMIFQRPAKF